jgi:hypothetical protein
MVFAPPTLAAGAHLSNQPCRQLVGSLGIAWAERSPLQVHGRFVRPYFEINRSPEQTIGKRENCLHGHGSGNMEVPR